MVKFLRAVWRRIADSPIGSCWWPRKRVDYGYSCRFCGIPHVMTQREFFAHQREVHPFTRNGVAL